MSDYLTATITLVDESTVSLSEGSIASGSWSFKKTTGSGGYEIGGCAISSCNFTIIDTVGNYNENDFENAEVSVFLNGSTTPYWKGYVKTATQAYNKIVITAYDKMAKGDEQVIGYINSTGKINMTRSDLASAIATFMGLTGVTGLNNGSAVIPEMDTTCTYRQAIAYMAEAGGQFAYVDTVNDRLVFAWYSGTETPANIFGRNLSRSGTTIDCVNVIAYDGEYAEISPSLGDMLIEVSGNPCIVGNRDTGTFTTDLTNIVNALVGNTFISGTLTIASDPDLEIGTYINLSHHGQPYLLPVASLTYKPNGTMVISCDNVGNMKVSSADMRSTSAQQSLYNDISNKKSKLAQALGQGGINCRYVPLVLASLTLDTFTPATMYAQCYVNDEWYGSTAVTGIFITGGDIYVPEPSILHSNSVKIYDIVKRCSFSCAGRSFAGFAVFHITIPTHTAAMTTNRINNLTLQMRYLFGTNIANGYKCIAVSSNTPSVTNTNFAVSFNNVIGTTGSNYYTMAPATTEGIGGIMVDGSDASVDAQTGLLNISKESDADVDSAIDDILGTS